MSIQKSFEKFLSRCVAKALRREHPFIIGVAGSVGKSSTKTAIGIALGALEDGSKVVMSDKNYNNDLGVPLAVFGCVMPGRSIVKWSVLLGKAALTALGILKLRAKTFVLEMGTDRPGDLLRLVKMAKPNIGVLTAIGPEHTEYFGGVDEVAKEEAFIFSTLTEGDTAIVNADDDRALEIAKSFKANVYSFGTSDQAWVRIVSTELIAEENNPEHSGLLVELFMSGETITIKLEKTAGKPQAYAAAAALACAAAMGKDLTQAAARLEKHFCGMPGRMRLLEGIKHTWLLDDSYNSSPLAVMSAIRDLSVFPINESAKRIAVLGDMLELGSLAEQSHVDMGRAVAEAGIDLLVLCGGMSGVVARAAKEAGMSDEAIFIYQNSSEAGLFVQERMKRGDVILIKGSQGIRMERVTKELMAHPDRVAELLVRYTPDWLRRTG
ncbi:MAG: Mur ligase family protein [Patescibacteria group bacterium]